MGQSQSGPLTVKYPVRHPEKVTHLVLHGTIAWGKRLPENRASEDEAVWTLIRDGWGKDNPAIRHMMVVRNMPGASAEQLRWMSDRERVSATAETVIRQAKESRKVDGFAHAGEVSVPTLVIHSRDDGVALFERARTLAGAIPNAQFDALESKTTSSWRASLSGTSVGLSSGGSWVSALNDPQTRVSASYLIVAPPGGEERELAAEAGVRGQVRQEVERREQRDARGLVIDVDGGEQAQRVDHQFEDAGLQVVLEADAAVGVGDERVFGDAIEYRQHLG